MARPPGMLLAGRPGVGSRRGLERRTEVFFELERRRRISDASGSGLLLRRFVSPHPRITQRACHYPPLISIYTPHPVTPKISIIPTADTYAMLFISRTIFPSNYATTPLERLFAICISLRPIINRDNCVSLRPAYLPPPLS